MSNTKEQEKPSLPTRDQLLDTSGRPLTQAIFLETIYSPFAVYSLKDEDHLYNNKIYPSIKKLYLEMGDVTEYEFATTYLLGMKHWLRICENKLMKDHVAEWRYELELKIRAQSIKTMIAASKKGSQSAAKWLAEKGWSDRTAGRPSKEEIEREKRIQMNLTDDFEEDIRRLSVIK